MIDHDAFIYWAQEHFEKVVTKEDEVLVNSIFCHDTKAHLWCNTRKNAYHCWKSDKHGNLFHLVAQVEKCSYEEAVRILGGDNILRSMEERVAKLYEKPTETINGELAMKPSLPPNEIDLPPDSFDIEQLPESNRHRQMAENHMANRKLNTKGLYVCVSGRYANRIVIPYYAPDGTLIYWNARDLTDRSKSKYMGPDETIGVKKRQVLWMSQYPKTDSKIYLTEGEFDAMSLNSVGFLAGAMGGKNLHNRQIELLHEKQWQVVKSCRICIALDSDKSGSDALNTIGTNLISNGIHNVTYIKPPAAYKDWNEMLMREGERILMFYVLSEERNFDQWTSAKLRL